MGLYERLLRLEEPRISMHAFPAIIGELRRGRVTEATIISQFGLDVTAQLELATLVARFTNGVPLTPAELHDVCLIADNKGIPAYKTVTALKNRLGV